MQQKIIGVVGGMGPYAGVDLVKKIFDETVADRDQDHLSVALLSTPSCIPDRSAYLTGATDQNPAVPIAAALATLSQMGAFVAGIPCNTAHAPRIFDEILRILQANGTRIRVLHIAEITVQYLQDQSPNIKQVGILSTSASLKERIYGSVLERNGLMPLIPDGVVQAEFVNRAIFDTAWGIKAVANPVSERARSALLQGIDHLREKGAEAVILGCTELPLAIPERELDGMPIIDSTLTLARALITEVDATRLKPYRDDALKA